MLKVFREWVPNYYEFEEMSGHFEELVRLIMKEEIEIGELHKGLLRKEEGSFGESWDLYQEAQRETKNNQEMFEYTTRLNQHFSQRMRAFRQISRKIEQYQYHLKQHEMCEKKLIEASEMIGSSGGLWTENRDAPLNIRL